MGAGRGIGGRTGAEAEEMIYKATITSSTLRVRESRIVAELLLEGVDDAEWHDAVIQRNVLQTGSAETARRVGGLLRARMMGLGERLWAMVRDGNHELATQAVFAGAVKNSRLLGDFMDLTIREQRALFARKLEPRMWHEYIEGCRGRDPDMPHWSDATIAKLKSTVFSMLAEAGYLQDTRSLILQNVFVHGRLATYLSDADESYVLRCMEVTQ